MSLTRSSATARSSLLARLQAWWEGDELPPPPLGEPQAAAPNPAVAEKGPSEVSGWTARRLEVAQRVFGPGCVGPGGEEAIRELLQPLGLRKDMRLLDVGARAGCLVRLVARELGCWAAGLEEDEVLATAASDMIRQAKLGKAASVTTATLRKNTLGRRELDVIVSREAMHLMADKDEVYACCKDLLKPGGQLLITDFVSRSPGVNPAVEVWAAHERIRAHLETPDRHRDLLEGHGFEIVALEDASQDYCRQLAATMQSFAGALGGPGLDGLDREWLKFEVELYARRVDFLKSGDLGVSRVHARLA